MRNLRKFLAVIVVVAMLATFAVPVFADEMTAAEQCETLGMLQGNGDGVTAEYLATAPTRMQAAIMYLRLLGLEDEALAYEGTANFEDAGLVWAGGQAILAYLLANPDLGWQGTVAGVTFDPLATIDAQSYYKVMLEALGYEQGVDFEWADVLTFAADKGLLAVADADPFTVADLATATVEALQAENSDGEVLIDALVADGIVTLADAQTAGLVEVELAVESVEPTDLNEVTVTFNKAVEDTDDISFKVKKGAAVYGTTVEWNEAGDAAVLTTVINLPAADYTVEITGAADEVIVEEFTVLAETVTALEVVSTTVELQDDNVITFKVSNQYGDDMSDVVERDDLGAVSVYNVTQGAAVTTGNVAAASEIALTDIEAEAEVGDILRVTISYKGFTVQANVEVIDVAAGDAISLGGIVLLGEDDTRLDENDGTVQLEYTLVDQYGEETSLTANKGTAALIAEADDIQFVSSDEDVIDGFSTNADGELILSVAGAGTALITAIVNASGVVDTVSVTVEEDEAPDSVTIAAPTAIVAGGDDAFDLAITIYDQYGTVINSVDDLEVDIDLEDAVVELTDEDDVTLVNVDLSGCEVDDNTEVTITITNADDDELGTVTFDVEANAVAFQIQSVSFGPLFEVDAEDAITVDDVTVVDQYGRAFTPATIELDVVSDDDDAFDVDGVNVTATAIGVATLEVSVDDGDATLEFDIECIDSGDIETYTIVAIDTLYSSTTSGAYNVDVSLEGVTADGEAVILADNDPDTVTTSKGTIIGIDGTEIYGKAAGTATVSAWLGTTKVASTTVTVSDEAPEAAAIAFDETEITSGSSISTILSITDQYGVDITDDEDAGFDVCTIISDGDAVVDEDGVITGDVGDTATVVVITNTGVEVSDVITIVAPD